jgi:Tol biopolymer transport system component
MNGNPQAAWHPSENILLYTEYVQIGGTDMNKLKLFDLDTRETRLISESNRLDEVLPSWSNDGTQITVIRREWIDGVAQVGDQIWLLDPATGAETQITTDPEVIHGQVIWSPDGEALIYHVYNLGNTGNPTEIRVLELASGKVTTIASPGTSPQWIP